MLAVSAGLFDAALNYLWDETIGELRKRIVAYDLNYFFDQAVTDPDKRKDLREPADLAKITDDELIRAAAKIGFISPVEQQQLDLVRYMRNHARAFDQTLGFVRHASKRHSTRPRRSSRASSSLRSTASPICQRTYG